MTGADATEGAGAMSTTDGPGIFRRVKRSVVAAAVLLAWDAGVCGSFLMSTLVCPVWFLVSLILNAIRRPGWGIALLRVGLPALTLLIVRANSDLQLTVAETNARRVVAACERYHAENGRFPGKLDELAPRYLPSVPPARYCLGPPSEFFYHGSENPLLAWQVVPPYYRKIYNFRDRRWSYLD